jgi:uroporphyrinogen-III synthase
MNNSLPLSHQRIVILREASRSQSIQAQIIKLGGQPIFYPILSLNVTSLIETISPSYLRSFDMLIVASQFSFDLLWSQLAHYGDPRIYFSHIQIYPIGIKTAQFIHSKGVDCERISTSNGQEGLLEIMPFSLHNKTILIPNQKQSRPFLANALTKRGAIVTVLPIYESVMIKPAMDIILKPNDWIAFTSSEAVRAFFVTHSLLPSQVPFVMGQSTYNILKTYIKTPIYQPTTSTFEGMIESMVDYANALKV